MELGCIYLITNLVNDKKYIGLTTDITPERRYKTHLYNANYGLDYALYRAIRLYGESNFKIEIVKIIEHSKLPSMEEYYAEQYGTYTWSSPGGYNMALCGDKPTLGFKHTPDELKKMSDARKNIVITETQKARTSESLKEWIKDNPEIVAERAKRIGLAQKGRPKTEETKDRIRQTLTGRSDSLEVLRNKINANISVGKLGEKYITLKENGAFTVYINNKIYGKLSKTLKTLEEAIKARDDFINANS